MNLWNFLYLSLAVVLMAVSVPAAALRLLVLCLVPVTMLWAGRWVADRARSRARHAVLAASPYTQVRDRRALEQVFSGLGHPLRDWMMRGYPTGLTQFWVRDAWRARREGLDIAVMELQTTPGYMGTGIPLWRVRHGAMVASGARAADVQAALLEALEQKPGGEVFVMSGDQVVVIVWRKRAPDGERMRWLLDRAARVASKEPNDDAH